ncbi:DUF4123 domain-containing protein [Klebsiella pasteurii]|uniref:DUF4123 domain-containing protein n=1 Tax=Klebsiella pasteurii TaxID=2587529 RepID=UPI00287EB5D7|nr:DUF4123 domain-containing protein [Klebsiella pasteurii]MDS7910878.1 DUF4123 domain-containing protein [Klebsiella pasteurii]
MENIKTWLDKIHLTCQQIGHNYIDIIIDQCGLNFSVIPALSGFSPAIKWQSLYQGLPENIYLDDAPFLVRIELEDALQVQWLYALAREAAATAPLLVLGSSWRFDVLAGWLVRCIDAQHEWCAGIFRFWDTRIFSYLFTHVLNSEQQSTLHRPVLFWSWLDRDGVPVLLEGNGAALGEEELSEKIILTDNQFESLMCLCDAKQFLGYQQLPEGIFTLKEAEFAACFEAMLAATHEHIIFDDKRDDWVRAYIVTQNKLSDESDNKRDNI